MTQLEIKYKKINELTAYAKNSRTHSDSQIEQLVASLKEFGFTNPILIDDKNGIVAGHGRIKAAQVLGMETVPTIKLGNLTDEQRRAYIIADNKLALNAGWDNDLLSFELQDLQDAGFDLSLTGFTDAEIEALKFTDEDVDEDHKEPTDETRNTLLIECTGERELETLYEEMQKRGFECKILS
jgi:ParB-like chromosome segregation protein Spo0J